MAGIDSTQNYTAIRHDLRNEFKDHGGSDAVRFTDGKKLYVKKNANKIFKFSFASTRRKKYADAADKIKESMNREFAGLTVNGGKIGDKVFEAFGSVQGKNPKALKPEDFKLLDEILASALKYAAEQKGGFDRTRMAAQVADLLDRSQSNKTSDSVKLKHWAGTVSGTQMLHTSIAQDLRAAGVRNPDQQANAVLKQLGIETHGLTHLALAKATNLLREQGIPTTSLDGLHAVLAMRSKFIASGEQFPVLNEKLRGAAPNEQLPNAAPGDPTVRQKVEDIIDHSKAARKSLMVHVRMNGLPGPHDRKAIFQDLRSVYRETVDLANKVQDELTKNLLMEHANATHDLAMSLMLDDAARNDAGITPMMDAAPPNEPSDLHTIQPGVLDQGIVEPSNIYQKATTADLASSTTLSGDVRHYNAALQDVQAKLQAFQASGSDDDLTALNRALDNASRKNDLLSGSLYRAARRHAKREGSFRKLFKSSANQQIKARQDQVAAQRTMLQKLKVMANRVDNQRNFSAQLPNIADVDKQAGQQRAAAAQQNIALINQPLPPIVPQPQDVMNMVTPGDEIDSDEGALEPLGQRMKDFDDDDELDNINNNVADPFGDAGLADEIDKLDGDIVIRGNESEAEGNITGGVEPEKLQVDDAGQFNEHRLGLRNECFALRDQQEAMNQLGLEDFDDLFDLDNKLFEAEMGNAIDHKDVLDDIGYQKSLLTAALPVMQRQQSQFAGNVSAMLGHLDALERMITADAKLQGINLDDDDDQSSVNENIETIGGPDENLMKEGIDETGGIYHEVDGDALDDDDEFDKDMDVQPKAVLKDDDSEIDDIENNDDDEDDDLANQINMLGGNTPKAPDDDDLIEQEIAKRMDQNDDDDDLVELINNEVDTPGDGKKVTPGNDDLIEQEIDRLANEDLYGKDNDDASSVLDAEETPDGFDDDDDEMPNIQAQPQQRNLETIGNDDDDEALYGNDGNNKTQGFDELQMAIDDEDDDDLYGDDNEIGIAQNVFRPNLGDQLQTLQGGLRTIERLEDQGVDVSAVKAPLEQMIRNGQGDMNALMIGLQTLRLSAHNDQELSAFILKAEQMME